MADEELVEGDFKHAIAEEIRVQESTLVQASDWPNFNERRGTIKGLKKAKDLFDTILKRQIVDDLDDDGEDDDLP